MSYLIALLLSALATNGVHGYLLLSQRTHRKWTISEHAVHSKNTFVTYVLGHVLGGAFFLIFAKQYFVHQLALPALFWLSIWTVAFEYSQALLPAKGKTNLLHTRTALVMWFSFILLGMLCLAFVPSPAIQKVLSSCVYAGILGNLLYAYRDRERIYRYQMAMVMLFYISLFILLA